MKLSNTVSYALQAVVRLADTFGGAPVPCSELAAAGRMPDRFLLQILRTLAAHEILVSTRGVFGGYTLARPPEEITLLDIIEAIDGRLTCTLPMAEAFPGVRHPVSGKQMRQLVRECADPHRVVLYCKAPVLSL